MNAVEWLGCTEPWRMLGVLGMQISRRKSLLVAATFCRRFWSHPSGSELLAYITLAEGFADGTATEAEVTQAFDQLVASGDVYMADWEAAMIGILDLVVPPIVPIESVLRFAKRKLGSGEADLLRDVFTNPFRPVAFDPVWRTSTVVTLARQMYESRDFGAMPILADALQDAGCTSEDVLGHCRGPGPHARGCWVADLVLGKE